VRPQRARAARIPPRVAVGQLHDLEGESRIGDEVPVRLREGGETGGEPAWPEQHERLGARRPHAVLQGKQKRREIPDVVGVEVGQSDVSDRLPPKPVARERMQRATAAIEEEAQITMFDPMTR
jgi:hypothetical protein